MEGAWTFHALPMQVKNYFVELGSLPSTLMWVLGLNLSCQACTTRSIAHRVICRAHNSPFLKKIKSYYVILVGLQLTKEARS